jgi:ribonuclease T2
MRATRAGGVTGKQAALAGVLIGVLLCSGTAQASRHHRSKSVGEPGQFDYYAMALSWAPAFCATHDDPVECAPGKRAGFVLHGLWPQYSKGYPQSCSTERLSDADRVRYAALYPSPNMITHEWSKHGTCSGLPPAAYFALSEKLRGQLAVPPAYLRPAQPVKTTVADFAATFRAANPRLPDNAVLPFCSANGRFLNEIHACYDKSGAAMSCGAAEVRRSQNTCRQDSFILQGVR